MPVLFSSAQEMLTNNTPTNEAPNVGIGFFINMSDNGEILGFGHGGADAGFMSQLYIELDTGNRYAPLLEILLFQSLKPFNEVEFKLDRKRKTI